jgi:chromosome segregation ATPase
MLRFNQSFPSIRVLLLPACFAAGVLLGAADAAAQAAKAENRDRETIRRLQQQLQKAQQDTTVVRGEKEALEKKLAEQKGELDKQAEALPKAQAEAGRERREKAALQAELDKLKAQLADREKSLAEAKALGDELAGKERTAVATIGERDRSVKTYQTDLARQNKEIVACEAKNAKLYELNVELVERYRTKSVQDALLQKDPFTGIKDVEVFNIVQEYRDKLDAQRVETPAAIAPPRP